jgi:hypothetical protein
MERRKFTREFRLEAVRLIRDQGVSFAQASPPASLALIRPGGTQGSKDWTRFCAVRQFKRSGFHLLPFGL